MPRPKDAKVWNEDLVKALDARHQQSHREGKRDVHLWRTGRDKVLAVRKDIYQFRTGSIVNLPTNLTKRVHRLCEDVIRGVKNVYPDGHVPTYRNNNNSNSNINSNVSASFETPRSRGTMETIDGRYSHQPATPLSNTAFKVASARSINSSSNSTNTNATNNPYQNYNYMKRIQIRGGAYAILMAFRYSVTEILTKRDICREAQKFCDEQMEGNYMAGRSFGAWSNIKTLTSHELVKAQGSATWTPNGFRSKPHSFSLTRDGEMFLEALLAHRPEAAAAARQAAGGDPRTPSYGGVGTTAGTPTSHHRARNFPVGSPLVPNSSSNSSSKDKNTEADKLEFAEWVETAGVGDRKEFKVGKKRRQNLHNLCDDLQRQRPGLLLTHGSLGDGRTRTMSIQLVSKPFSVLEPSSSASASMSTPAIGSRRKRPCSPVLLDLEEYPETTQSSSSSSSLSSRPHLTAQKRAGLAAAKRQEENKEKIQFKTAILESAKIVATPPSRQILRAKGIQRQQHHTKLEGNINDADDDEELQTAIKASLQETSKKPSAVKRNIFAICDSSDDELPGPVFSPSPIRKKRKPNPLSEARKPPAQNSVEICCIDSDSDNDDDKKLPAKMIVSSLDTTGRKKRKKPRAVTSEELSKTEPSSIDLCESSDDESDVNDVNNDVIEIRENLEEPIDLSNSQLSQGLDYMDNVDDGDEKVDGDEIIIVEDDIKEPETTYTTAQISSPKGRCPKKNSNDLFLTVWIDNRERNRNATPRTLRMELARHLATGPLSDVWPKTMPLAKVEEAGLEWGDIQYGVQSDGSSEDQSTRRLGVSIERKRVNDLVQRSSDGDHLVQLFRMKQHCSLSILLIENDTRTARSVVPYNAQNKERFDPLDPTITCEDDIYRMFGRILLSSDSIKFVQTRDEQASLRAIGAIGLMAVFAPSKCTKELENSRATLDMEDVTTTTTNNNNNRNSKGAQALTDQLKQGGIPWRLAKRVASVVGCPIELKALYDSCCNETAKSQLLSHIITTGEEHDRGDLKSSATGWSDAIYRIVAASWVQSSSSSDTTKLCGEAALLLHKELIEDHGFYLSTLYQQGHSPEETLEKVLDNPASSPTRKELAQRYVTISLNSEQATKYFPTSRADGDRVFYKLSVLSDDQSRSHYGAITMQAVSRSLASKTLLVFEMEGSDVVDLVRDSWSTEKGYSFVSLAKTVARLVNNICHEQGRGRSSSGNNRILMVCGLQPALDANAKKSGYTTETRTVVDLVFAELLLCYDVTIIQALRKNSDDRVNLVRQLALACFHCGLLVQNCNR